MNKIKYYFERYLSIIKTLGGLNKIKFTLSAPILFFYYKLIKSVNKGMAKKVTIFKSIITIDRYKFECREKSSDLANMASSELETLEFLSSQKGKIFIDVGAFIGKYSILLSKNFEKIISIEADPYNYSQLVRNIKLNNLWNKIIPLNVALTNDDGILKLNLSEEGGEGTFDCC